MIEDPVYQCSVLANGLTVATFPMPWLHECGVMLFVRAGSRFEADPEAGMAHFLEHMLFKGTRSYPDPLQLHARLETMAADMNASTGQESNAYWISLPVDYLAEGFATFCEIFTEPVFAGIDTERQVVLSEMREDENELGEIINPATLSAAKLWPGHPLSRSVMGTPATIQRITREGLGAYLRRHYQGANMALAFFGPVDHGMCLGLAERGLSGLPRGEAMVSPPPPPMGVGPHWVSANDQTSQFTLSWYFRCGGFRAPEYHAIGALRRLLDDGFASRLQATIREEQGLVYDVWASVSSSSDSGAFEVGAVISPEHLETVFQALSREIGRLCREPPEAGEWVRVVNRWRASLVTTLDHPIDLLERYVADRLFDANETLAFTWEQVQKIRPEELPALARQLFRPEAMVLVLVGAQAKWAITSLQRLFQRHGFQG